MTIVLIMLALFVALFELARGYAESGAASMPEPRKIDDEDERRR
jgi:hypothetical protein